MHAIDVLGPQVSMREIADQAKIPKARLYRFFTDKPELASAISDRIQEMVAERIASGPTEEGATLGRFLRSGITRYLELANDHPNIFRFMILTISEAGESADLRLERKSEPARDIASVLRAVIVAHGGTDNDVELVAYMLVGSIINAGNWWLMRGRASNATLAGTVDKVDSNVRALVQSAANANNVHIDFDAPIAEYFSAAASS